MLNTVTLFIFIIATAITCAQQPADVSVNASNYTDITTSLSAGYFKLDARNRFNPTQAVNRSDMARIIGQLDQKLTRKYFNMTQADFEELLYFNQSFKSFVINTESDINRLGKQVSHLDPVVQALDGRQLTSETYWQLAINELNQANTDLRMRLETLEGDTKKNRTLLWLAIGLSVGALVAN